MLCESESHSSSSLISISSMQCGNLLQDADAQMKPLKSCIKDSCTDMSDEAFTFLGVGDSDKVSAFVRQLGMECRPRVNLFDLTMFPGGSSSTSDDSETTTSRSGGDESTSSSRESSSGVSSTTSASASASATDSSDSATNILMALPDTAFVATLVCGLIMAVTVYAL